jgi:hypothetical protein
MGAITVDERSREVRSVVYNHRKKLRILVVTSLSERLPTAAARYFK